jgi:hypothetical protein
MHAITGWFIVLVLAAIAIYDVWIIRTRGIEWSISRFVRVGGERWPLLHPLLAFAAGCLYGHFFL